MRYLSTFIALLFATHPAQAQGARATTPADAKRILSVVAADSMEGRATGTRGALRAATYIAGQMKRIGLTPLGDSGFFQKVPLWMDSTPIRGRGGVEPPPGTPSFRWRPRAAESFAALDTIPPARRRTDLNVVGIIRGSDPALRDEYVLVGAHHDHIGIRAPVNGDSIANGADDDASGVTAVLEIARQLKQGPAPKRSIIFTTSTGEEVGYIGTRWFIAHPPVPLEKVVVDLQIEMINRPDSLAKGSGGAWLTGYERSTMGEMFAAAGLPVHPDARPDASFFTRSDNYPFALQGIVAHTLSSFNGHMDYHDVTDETDRADFVHMAAVINTAAKAVRLLADGVKPEWKPGGRPEAGVRR